MNSPAGEQLAHERGRSIVWESTKTKCIAPSTKVLLLNPLIIKKGRKHHFLTDWTGSEYPSSLLSPPMEFLYMHAALRRIGVRVDFCDASARSWQPTKAVRYVADTRPELVFLPATYNSVNEILTMASQIRLQAPATRIVVFGPPATVRPDIFLKAAIVDVVILGEPEKPSVDIVQGQLTENIAFLEEGTVHCLHRVLLEPLDWLPHPSRHLLNPMDYVAPFSRAYPFTVVVTSRGCIHAKCRFCTQHVWAGSTIRYHSLDYVVEELRDVVRNLGYREIFFRDQVFTADRDRTIALCERMIAEKLIVPWRATTRVDRIDEELLAIMKKAGCYQITYGFESSLQHVLDTSRKGITVEQSFRAAEMTRRAGIEVVGNFVIGLEGDTVHNLENISRYAIDLGCDFAQFIPAQIWHDNPDGNGTLGLGKRTIENLSSKAYRRFYLRPSFAIRMLGRLKDPRLVRVVLRSAFRILTERQVY